MLLGNGYLEVVGEMFKGLFVELYVLCLDWMVVVFGVDGWFEVYEYVVGGCKVCFDMIGSFDLICYICSFYLLDDYYGLLFM